MDPPQLRHLLALLCDEKRFSLKVADAKFDIIAKNVFIWDRGIHYLKSNSKDFKGCENYKEGEDDEDETKYVPHMSESEIEQLVKCNKRKFPNWEPTMFKCERCRHEFDIYHNPSNDCVWHTGYRTTDLTDVIWADHDVEKYGAIEDLIDQPDFEDRWVWSCCGEFGSDEGCKCTPHKVLEEFTGYEDTTDDSSEDSEDTEEPPRKRSNL